MAFHLSKRNCVSVLNCPMFLMIIPITREIAASHRINYLEHRGRNSRRCQCFDIKYECGRWLPARDGV